MTQIAVFVRPQSHVRVSNVSFCGSVIHITGDDGCDVTVFFDDSDHLSNWIDAVKSALLANDAAKGVADV
jgi:hypothetical protein